MISQLHKRYLLRDYWLEPDKRLLGRGGRPVHLPKKPFQVLLHLIENRDRYVSRAELLDLFWEGQEVYDEALRKCVGTIRKALDDQSDSPRFVETRWGVGYRYVGPVEEQLVQEETAITEIERTHEVKIVVEEEEIRDEGAATEKPTTNLAPALSPPPAPKRYAKITALALTLLAAAVYAAPLVRYLGRPDAGEGGRAPVRSVAVLPLRNLTGDPADEYLSDGITESLITALSKVEGLKVISRSSVFTFKDKNVDPREAGRLLGVAAVLEGSVRRRGGQVRVDVRLVSASGGEVLWATEAYDRPVGDIFAVQDETARNVVAGLRIRLSEEGERRIVKHYTDNAEAYQAYLKGRYFLNKRTRDGIERATEYFQRAVALDPNYALAYAALAESYDKYYWLGFVTFPPKEVMAKQRAAATKALTLDDSLAEAHIAMGSVFNNEWDLVSAARELERAIQIDPRNAEAHHNYAYRLLDMLRPDEAVAQIKLALELDPLNVVMHVDMAEILLLARRYDEAIAAYHHALEMDPNRANAHEGLGWAYEFKGMYDEAVAAFLRSFVLNGRSPEEVTDLRRAYESGGIRGYWRKSLEQELRRDYTEPVNVGNIYTRLGDKDKAFTWYEKAYRMRSPSLLGAKSSAKVDSLRSDPRYNDLVRRVGLP